MVKRGEKSEYPAARARAKLRYRPSSKNLDAYEKARWAAEQKARDWVGMHITRVRERMIRCGKPRCRACPHGVYFYEVWKGDDGKPKERYLGKFREATPAEVARYDTRALSKRRVSRTGGADESRGVRRRARKRAGAASAAS